MWDGRASLLASRAARRFERRIPAYLNGALSDRRRRWFERQLAVSEACRSELRSYRRLDDLIVASLPRDPDGRWARDLGSRIRERIRREGGVVGGRGQASGRVRGRALAHALAGALWGLVIASAGIYVASVVRDGPGPIGLGEDVARNVDRSDVAETPDGPFGAAGFGDDRWGEPLGVSVTATRADGLVRGGARWAHGVEAGDEVLPDPSSPIDLYRDGALLVVSADRAGRSR